MSVLACSSRARVAGHKRNVRMSHEAAMKDVHEAAMKENTTRQTSIDSAQKTADQLVDCIHNQVKLETISIISSSLLMKNRFMQVPYEIRIHDDRRASFQQVNNW